MLKPWNGVTKSTGKRDLWQLSQINVLLLLLDTHLTYITHSLLLRYSVSSILLNWQLNVSPRDELHFQIWFMALPIHSFLLPSWWREKDMSPWKPYSKDGKFSDSLDPWMITWRKAVLQIFWPTHYYNKSKKYI